MSDLELFLTILCCILIIFRLGQWYGQYQIKDQLTRSLNFLEHGLDKAINSNFRQTLRVEEVDGIVLLYDQKTDAFLGQGSTFDEAFNDFAKNYKIDISKCDINKIDFK